MPLNLLSLLLLKPSLAHIRDQQHFPTWHSLSSNNENIRLTNRVEGPNNLGHSQNSRDPKYEYGATNYINILLQLDRIPTIYNLLASIMTWILLAGYLILPLTFTSLQNSTAVAEKTGKAGTVVLRAYWNLPLLWVAAIFCVIGASDMTWLWWMWKWNYI
ncbi:uncharacterized protein EAF01_001301 [Botrytis porri]|uniref:uncharacterized protein n=1 Tax=Botrytis porri TaxID=87229 RepID=UPI00190225DA|nr:uncharacterized protein EAF01_001301 [Botrytis porri]KAF7912280.1 hypothetical protein EAF01_001301 [Botrytis porri]